MAASLALGLGTGARRRSCVAIRRPQTRSPVLPTVGRAREGDDDAPLSASDQVDHLPLGRAGCGKQPREGGNMRFALFVAAVLSVVACGPSFDGTYAGPLTSIGSCSDGSGVPSSTVQVRWVLSESGSGVDVTTGGTCGDFAGDVPSGSTTDLRQKTCPAYSNGPYTYNSTVTGGTLTLSGSSLAVSFQTNILVSGAASGSCSTSTSGTLQSQ